MLNGQNSDEITTAVVQNVPYQYNLKELLAEFDNLGLWHLYDFVFLPSGVKNTRANLGYVFVNLHTPTMYSQFVQALTHYRFEKRAAKSCKRASVKPAKIQGLHGNLTLARKTAHPDAFFVAKASWPVHIPDHLPDPYSVQSRFSR